MSGWEKRNPPPMTELEADVIEAAIEFIDQFDHGLYSDRERYRNALRHAVSELRANGDGEWRRPEGA